MGCREVKPQDELVRVVRTPDGGLAFGRALAGRGAWLCSRSDGCVEAAVNRRAFTRALKGHVRDDAIERFSPDGPNARGLTADRFVRVEAR